MLTKTMNETFIEEMGTVSSSESMEVMNMEVTSDIMAGEDLTF